MHSYASNIPNNIKPSIMWTEPATSRMREKRCGPFWRTSLANCLGKLSAKLLLGTMLRKSHGYLIWEVSWKTPSENSLGRAFTQVIVNFQEIPPIKLAFRGSVNYMLNETFQDKFPGDIQRVFPQQILPFSKVAQYIFPSDFPRILTSCQSSSCLFSLMIFNDTRRNAQALLGHFPAFGLYSNSPFGFEEG